MQTQYENNLLCSVFLWAQWKLQQYGQAYINVTTPLYYTADPRLPAGWVGYSAPFKSWVYDSGVSGAYILQNVSGGSNVLDRSSGVHIDYANGRVILPSSYGTNLTLSGSYAMCEVNIYTSNETEDQILTQTKNYLNPRYMGAATGGIAPYVFATPAMFVNTIHQLTDAYQFGGLNDCTTTFSFVILAESNYQLQALLSVFRDTRYQYIPMLTINQDPLDGFGAYQMEAGGDTKGGSGYNYVSYIGQYGTPGNLIYIKDVHTSKVSDRVQMNPLYFGGVVDIDVGFVRQSPIIGGSFT